MRAVAEETKADIYAAKTIAEADEAFLAGVAKFNEIKSLSDKNAAQATKEFSELKTKYAGEIKAYVDYKVASLAATGTTSDYAWTPGENTPTGMKKALVESLDDAYTVDELKAAYEKARAEVDNLKTKADLNAAQKALDERVKAYTTTTVVTVADKEVVATLLNDIEAHNDYCEMIGNTLQKVVSYSGVTAAKEKIKNLEANAIKDAIKAIGTVTLDDEKAIDAVQAMLDDYAAYYAGEDAEDKDIAALKGVDYLGTTVAKLQAELEAEKVKAFKIMVGKLPADGSDVAGIKAARAAYEDLSRASKKAVYRDAEYDKLLDLEKILAVSVQTLKITARCV